MMFRAQQYIANLLENVAEGQLSTDEYRLTFGKVKEKLATAEDFEAELRNLYKVMNFSDFALSLMWIADRVEQDPSKLEYTPSEQAVVIEKFRLAVGDMSQSVIAEPPPTEPAPVAEQPFETSEPASISAVEPTQEEPPALAVQEELPEMPAHLQMETPGHIDQSEQGVYAPPPVEGVVSDPEFAGLLEKFVEAMQSGTDERTTLFDSLLQQASAISGVGGGSPDDIREFCQYLIEFLTYVRENGFMDDVRVMNILSNISSPVSTWAGTDPGSRSGLLSEGIEILRTFKSLFE